MMRPRVRSGSHSARRGADGRHVAHDHVQAQRAAYARRHSFGRDVRAGCHHQCVPRPRRSRFRPTRSLAVPRRVAHRPHPRLSRSPVPQTSFTSRNPPWTPRLSRSSASRASTPTTRPTSPSPWTRTSARASAGTPSRSSSPSWRSTIPVCLQGLEVSVWDRIVERKESALLHIPVVRNKYKMVDRGANLRGREVTFSLRWTRSPHAGRITGDALEFQDFTFPEEYLSEPETTNYGRHRARRAPETRRGRSEGRMGTRRTWRRRVCPPPRVEAPRRTAKRGGRTVILSEYPRRHPSSLVPSFDAAKRTVSVYARTDTSVTRLERSSRWARSPPPRRAL